jgi:hypothetical protein
VTIGGGYGDFTINVTFGCCNPLVTSLGTGETGLYVEFECEECNLVTRRMVPSTVYGPRCQTPYAQVSIALNFDGNIGEAIMTIL